MIQDNASAELIELAKLTQFPITNTLMGLGAFPGTDPQFLGMLGMHGTYEANMAMHEADLIIAVGARFDDRITNDPKQFALSAKKIHIDVDPASLSKIINADVPIAGSAKECLSVLISQLSKEKIDTNKLEPWLQKITNWREEHGLNHSMLEIVPENEKYFRNKLFNLFTKKLKVKLSSLLTLANTRCLLLNITFLINRDNGLTLEA